MTSNMPPLLQINGQPFYNIPNYLNPAQLLLPGPIYRINRENRIMRCMKQIFFAPYRLIHGWVGRYVIRACQSKYDLNQDQAHIDIKKNFKFLRTTIEVNGYFSECLIAGTTEMLSSKNVLFHLQDDPQFYEQAFNDKKLDNLAYAASLNAAYVAVNLPGIGRYAGFPNLDRSKKVCQAVFEMIQNKEKGLGANNIIIRGNGLGTSLQAATLSNEIFRELLKHPSDLNSCIQMSELMALRAKEWASKKWNFNINSKLVRLIGFLAAKIIKLSGWEILTFEINKNQNIIFPIANGCATSLNNGDNIIGIEEIVTFLCKNGKKGVVKRKKQGTNSFHLITWKDRHACSHSLNKMDLFLKKENANNNKIAITNECTPFRLGDNILSFLHAKWLAYKYKLPFVYTPFKGADQFMIENYDQPLDKVNYINKELNKEEDLFKNSGSFFYTVPYFPNSQYEFEMISFKNNIFFTPDWEDEEFKKEIAKCLAPKNPVPTLSLPKDRRSIAVHVRRGGGFDNPEMAKMFPLKFPSDDYYIEQIKSIAKIFEGQNLYVYIFTDDLDPKSILNKYKETIQNSKIKFACREEDNGPNANILEDFYSMTKFDCIILPQSNFSVCASKLGNYSIEITPLHASETNNNYYIDEVELKFNPCSVPI